MTRGARAALLAILAGAVLAPVPAGAAPVRRSLVVLLADHAARTAPAAHAPRLTVVADRRPLTGVRTVLPVLGRATTNSHPWVRVLLPGRPNGRRAWISAADTLASSTPWRLTVDLSARTVSVRHLGRVVRRFPAIVGAPSTPTPRGHFFVEEAMSLSAAAAGSPFALATSARSDVFQEFDGGPGQIALHGTGNLAGTMGSAASHGCVRLGTADITWLARRIGAGVPVTVTR
ncbi:MAG: L,D-transpeptidase [Solirubrobacterales bacterium]|nr:L,D-transpeptidase [Solirubrobacterales bacterium]